MVRWLRGPWPPGRGLCVTRRQGTSKRFWRTLSLVLLTFSFILDLARSSCYNHRHTHATTNYNQGVYNQLYGPKFIKHSIRWDDCVARGLYSERHMVELLPHRQYLCKTKDRTDFVRSLVRPRRAQSGCVSLTFSLDLGKQGSSWLIVARSLNSLNRPYLNSLVVAMRLNSLVVGSLVSVSLHRGKKA